MLIMLSKQLTRHKSYMKLDTKKNCCHFGY